MVAMVAEVAECGGGGVWRWRRVENAMLELQAIHFMTVGRDACYSVPAHFVSMLYTAASNNTFKCTVLSL